MDTNLPQLVQHRLRRQPKRAALRRRSQPSTGCEIQPHPVGIGIVGELFGSALVVLLDKTRELTKIARAVKLIATGCQHSRCSLAWWSIWNQT